MNSDNSVEPRARPIGGAARSAIAETGEGPRVGRRPRPADSVGRPVGPADMVGGERGSVLPLLALVAVGMVIATGLITVTTERHVRTARAQWAADAAALAAAAVGVESGGDGPGPGPGAVAAAKALAEANGARLISIGLAAGPSANSGSGQQAGHAVGATMMRSIVVIRVEYGGVQAESAAQRLVTGNP